jgi:hypothetical protein
MDSEIDSIIQELKADEISTAQNKSIVKIDEKIEDHLTDQNVNEYVYRKSSELVESTLSAVNSLKDTVLTGNDPKEISALSQLINSATKALDQLNKINLQNKQNNNNLQMKKMEIESNSHLSKMNPQTNNIVIATRDEIMERIFDKSGKREKLQIIDTEITK